MDQHIVIEDGRGVAAGAGHRRHWRLTRRFSRTLAAAALAAALAGGCGGSLDLDVDRRERPCRPHHLVTWYTPDKESERHALDAWCQTVGTPVVLAALPPTARVARLLVVSWNVNVGSGDLGRLVRDLQSGTLTNGERSLPVVLLVQEAVRSRGDVPLAVDPRSPVPARIGLSAAAPARSDTVETAAALGLAGIYVPSMRNGRAEGDRREDRGAAILSALPLSALRAIELPIERQRRVVVAARIDAIAEDDEQGLWVMSVHLENRSGGRRVWLESPRARKRQVRALLDDVLPDGPMIVGGDWNSWAANEPALELLREEFDSAVAVDRKPTHMTGRIDEIFARLPSGWVMTVRRLDHSYGSDHYPLMGILEVPTESGAHAGRAGRGISARLSDRP
jgi:endonuclease/exonuclease/phosphatase family metal-dependent hydrolase